MYHRDLFDTPGSEEAYGSVGQCQHIEISDGSLSYYRNFVYPNQQPVLFDELVLQIAWQRPHVKLYGKSFPTPRQVAYYGDPGAEYRYSGVVHSPLNWLPRLKELRNQISRAAGRSFNAVLANYYSDGFDHMGWHADNEPELGLNPCIASLSLGTRRDFVMKHRRTGERRVIGLDSGSLLIMSGTTQQHWVHALPKRARVSGGRLNLTFRQICI